jgi:uncharacterized membrane protein (UPF0127 family)
VTEYFGKVRVANHFFGRFLGLMGRRQWPASHRGLFFPRCGSVHTFFTFLRPDLLFLDKNNKILRIHPSAKPWLVFFGPIHTYGCLELPQDTACQLGLHEGDFFDGPFNN